MILGVPAAFLAALWLAWSAGATADGDRVARVVAVVTAVTVAVAGGAIAWRGRRGVAIAVGLALMAAAAGILRAASVAREGGPTSPVTPRVVAVRGTVAGHAEWRGAAQWVPLRVEAVARAPGQWEATDGPAVMRAPIGPVWVPGDVVEASPRGTTRTTFEARDVRLLAAAPTATGANHAPMAELRRRLAVPVEAWLPEPEASLATSILLGDRTGLPSWLRGAFNATGATHLIAISGWNVALVAGAIGWLTTRGPTRRRPAWRVARSILASASLWAFVALVGASGSVLRAAVMAQVALGARATGRRAATGGALLWAAVALAGADPATLEDVGWQLSVLGAAGIIWLAPWLAARLAPPPGAWWAPGLPATVREMMAGAIAAQACVLPVLAGTLGSVPLLGVVATTPGILLIPPLMGATAVLAVVGDLLVPWPTIAAIALPSIATVAWAPTALLVRLVAWGATLPGAVTTSPPWHGAAVFAYLAGLVLLVAVAESTPRPPAPRPARTSTGPLGAGLAILMAALAMVIVPGIGTTRAAGAPPAGTAVAPGLAPAVVPGPGPRARVIVPALEGGSEGTLVIVSMPAGPRLAIGGGPTVGAAVQALGASIRPWDRMIDAVVIASPDESSLVGLPRVLARYPVATVLDLTAGTRNALLAGIRTDATRAGVTVVEIPNGTPRAVGDAVRAEAGACPGTPEGVAVIVPIGAGPTRIGRMPTGPTAWPAVAVRVCAGWADITVVPDVTGAAIWLAHAPEPERWPLVAPSGRPRWLVVPWRAWRTDALDTIREATGASRTIVQGAPEPWRSPPTRPAASPGAWWLAALDGTLDVGDDR